MTNARNIPCTAVQGWADVKFEIVMQMEEPQKRIMHPSVEVTNHAYNLRSILILLLNLT